MLGSEPLSFLVFSEYADMSDGAKLACHVSLPKNKLEPKYPAAICFDRYHFRANHSLDYSQIQFSDSEEVEFPEIDNGVNGYATSVVVRRLNELGFAVVFIDLRGSGASVGSRTGLFDLREQNDIKEAIQWVKQQLWCNKKAGLFGRSYRGIAQMLALADVHNELFAVCPEMAIFDLHNYIWRGGIAWTKHPLIWSKIVDGLGTLDTIVTTKNGPELEEIIRQRELDPKNEDLLEALARCPSRSACDTKIGFNLYDRWSPDRLVEQINESNTPCLSISGWYDIWTRDAFEWYTKLTICQVLVVGPWCHCGGQTESLSLMERWLAKWANSKIGSITRKKKIVYYVVGAKPGKAWRKSETWPPKDVSITEYKMTLNGSLSTVVSHSSSVSSAEICGTTIAIGNATSGPNSRWANLNGVNFGYRAQIFEDDIIYHAHQQTAELEVIGEPIVRLLVSSSKPSVSLFFYLEAVLPNGAVKYVTEGAARIILRKQKSFLSGDQTTADFYLSDELCVSMLPICFRFRVGEQIRLRISTADRDNTDSFTEVGSVIHIYHINGFVSNLQLPIINELSVLSVDPISEIFNEELA